MLSFGCGKGCWGGSAADLLGRAHEVWHWGAPVLSSWPCPFSRKAIWGKVSVLLGKYLPDVDCEPRSHVTSVAVIVLSLQWPLMVGWLNLRPQDVGPSHRGSEAAAAPDSTAHVRRAPGDPPGELPPASQTGLGKVPSRRKSPLSPVKEAYSSYVNKTSKNNAGPLICKNIPQSTLYSSPFVNMCDYFKDGVASLFPQNAYNVWAQLLCPKLPDLTRTFPSGHCDGAGVPSLSPGPLQDPHPQAVSVCLLSPGFCCGKGPPPGAGLASHRGFSPSSGNGGRSAQSVLVSDDC